MPEPVIDAFDVRGAIKAGNADPRRDSHGPATHRTIDRDSGEAVAQGVTRIDIRDPNFVVGLKGRVRLQGVQTKTTDTKARFSEQSPAKGMSSIDCGLLLI